MTPERWQHARQILHEALERDPQRRGAFLTEACAGDDALRSEVEALLAADREAGSFLEKPVALSDLPAARIHLSPGTRISSYEIRALIGAGGMGAVY